MEAVGAVARRRIWGERREKMRKGSRERMRIRRRKRRSIEENGLRRGMSDKERIGGSESEDFRRDRVDRRVIIEGDGD